MRGSDNALGQFLRARRARVDPEERGLPRGRRSRRGLRREEVATLAGVSTPYYTRLEQGRDRHPSEQVVDALARVLGLDAPACDHLRSLAGIASSRPGADPSSSSVSPQLQRLMDGWDRNPAVVIGRYRQVVAANRLARVLNPGFEPGRNLIEHAFVDPHGREFYVDWRDVAEGAVAGLRASAGTDLTDPVLQALVSSTSLASPEFAEMWDQHDVRPRAGGSKRYRHPRAGVITLDYETFTVTAAPDQTLFVFHAREDDGADGAMRLLRKIAEEG